MLPVKSFDYYSPWTESTGNIKRLDRMASLFILILYRKFTIHISFIKKNIEFACISIESL